MLYSVMPMEVVFGNYYGNEEKKSDSQNLIKYMEILYLGERVEVSMLSSNRYVINRLISTSPKAYLDPRLKPGMVIGEL